MSSVLTCYQKDGYLLIMNMVKDSTKKYSTLRNYIRENRREVFGGLLLDIMREAREIRRTLEDWKEVSSFDFSFLYYTSSPLHRISYSKWM